MIPNGPIVQGGHRHTKSFLEAGAERTRPAGTYTTDAHGMPVMTAKLVHVPEIIRVEKPSAPIRDQNTTYNTTHTKAGFPYHYSPEKPREVELKHQQTYERVPAGKRHPFEVKSRTSLLQRNLCPISQLS